MPQCRICKAEVSKPLLELHNVPRAAQNMPSTPQELSEDRGVDLSICHCPGCGVLQHTAQPVAYYREVIRASGISEAMRQYRVKQFTSWVERYGLKGKKVFEAGCGRGEYLELMNASGVNAVGIEAGAESCSHCQKKGLTVFKNFFEKGSEELPGAPYDGFFVLNFLEHIPDIPTFLTGIRNNLTEGAAGIVEVPNLDMILANSQLTEFSTEHLYYFTAATLTNLLQNHGFDVISCNGIWYDYILSAEVVKRRSPDLSRCNDVKARLQQQISQFISECNGKTVFWGAGHQAQTTLALTGMDREKIFSVIDSSPEKQNRFTFTTHIPIAAPDILNDGEIKGVIIACGGYSDEVAGIISSRFANDLKLAVLRENKLEYLK